MKIGARQIDTDQPPYIIAEIGVNHDGSVDRALELVDLAKRAGADAIKLQLFQTDYLLGKAARLARYQEQAGADDAFAMLRQLELSAAQMRPIMARARALDLHSIVTVFSVELVSAARLLDWEAYKTASPDIINRPLIEALMAIGRPIILSTGAATLAEVKQAAAWLGDYPHLLMQCVSAYPTPDEYAALAARAAIAEVCSHALGYSDHTTGIDTGGLAVASGARLLEKHLTYDRGARGPDHAASLDPAAFADYVRLAHRAFCMLGPPCKQVLDIEQDVRNVSRQSLTSTRSLPAGHRLLPADLTVKRPGIGISPALLDEIIGRHLAKSIEADMPITQEHLR